MPKVFTEDFEGDDKEFKAYKRRWLLSTIYALPEKVKDKTTALMILTPIYVMFGIYVMSEYLPNAVLDKLILNANNTTVESMITSHYLHSLSTMEHIFSTTILFFLSMMAIIALNNRRRPIFQVTYVIFLLALPFTLSAYNLLLMQYLGITRVVGFSGISCAFFGYACYLLIVMTWNFAITYNYGKYEAVPWFYVNKFLMGAMLIIIIPIVYYALEYIVLNSHADAITHIAGFTYGLIVPQLVALILGTRHDSWRAYSLLLLFIMLAAPVIIVAIRGL